MPVVSLSQKLVDDAKIQSQASHRSTPKQIEHWATIGKIVEENPDLPYSFVSDILLGQEEIKAGKATEYSFG